MCPPLPGTLSAYDVSEIVDAVLDDPRASGVRAVSPHMPDADVAHLAIGLATGGAVAPVLLVLGGSSGELAPAVGFSQKASRRAVSGYVLIDAALPPVESRGGDWPDAPVHVIASPSAEPLEVNQARLRGWAVHPVDALTPAAIASVLLDIATA